MLPFLPANVQHVIHLLIACAVAVFVVLKSDPTLGTLPWVVAGTSLLTVLNSIFTASPGEQKRSADLKDRVEKLSARLGGGLGIIVLTFFLGGCTHSIGPVPQPVIDDFTGLVQCVVSNMSNWENLLARCSTWTIAEIEAAIAWLIANPHVSAEHPEWMDTLKARLVDAKARQAQLGVSK